MYDKLISLLTDNYSKSPESKIGKLFKIIADELQLLNDTFIKIEDYRDVDTAVGYTLDKIGSNVKQYRGVATDEIYRILIKSKRARNLSTGDINTIIDVVAQSINADPSEVQLVEMYNDPDDPEPAAVKMLEIPLAKINEVGMSSLQFGRMISKTLAAGISLKEIRMEGTFEFGDIGEAYDNAKGFGDVNNAVTGGYLGATYSPGSDVDLPL
jgi:hypothetical protein